MNYRGNAGNTIEAFFEQQRAGAKFVIARAVALFAGDQNDFFVRRRMGSEWKREKAERKQATFSWDRDSH